MAKYTCIWTAQNTIITTKRLLCCTAVTKRGHTSSLVVISKLLLCQHIGLLFSFSARFHVDIVIKQSFLAAWFNWFIGGAYQELWA